MQQLLRAGTSSKLLYCRVPQAPFPHTVLPVRSGQRCRGTHEQAGPPAAEAKDTPADVNRVQTEASQKVSSSGDSQTSTATASPASAATATTGVSSHAVNLDSTDDEDLFASKELISELQSKENFGQRGEVWFIAQAVVIVLVLFPPLTPLKGIVDLLATLTMTAGLVFIGYALLSLGRNLSPLPAPRKRHSLTTSGMYSYVRHPMYAGCIMAAFGLAALSRNETRLALAALLWYILEQKVALEEKMLSERYPEYSEYKAKVKKFFPFLY